MSRRLGHRDPHTTAKIYAHALPNTDQNVAAKWDKLTAPKVDAELPPQIGTNEQVKATLKQ